MHSFKLIISCFYITVAIPTMPKRKENESEEKRNKRLEADRLLKALSRGNETPEESNGRLEVERNRARSSRSIETLEQRKRKRNTNESEEIRNKRLEAINKAQGHTLKAIGIDLSSACFAHGMFYVSV